MPATIVQSKQFALTSPGDPFNVTLDNNVTAGNMVFIIGGGDTVLQASAGSTLNERCDFIGASNQHSIWDEVIASSGAFSRSIDPASGTGPTTVFVMEISGLTATPFDKVATSSGTGTTQATGTTATTAQADEFLIATWIAWCNASALRTWSAQTNSFVELVDFGHSSGSTRVSVCVATRTVSSTGAYTSTATVSSSTSTDQTAAIATYRIDTGGGAPADIPSLVMARSV